MEVHVQDEGARRELQQGDFPACLLVCLYVVMSLTVAGAEQARLPRQSIQVGSVALEANVGRLKATVPEERRV